MNRFIPKTKPAKLSAGLMVFVGAMLMLSLSRQFGIVDLLDTFRVAPRIATIFTIGALVALLSALRTYKPALIREVVNGKVMMWSWIFLIIGLVPLLPFFFVLLLAMIMVSLYLLSKRPFRNTSYY
jgi:hypothetical protein